jgi:hypothetical protein
LERAVRTDGIVVVLPRAELDELGRRGVPAGGVAQGVEEGSDPIGWRKDLDRLARLEPLVVEEDIGAPALERRVARTMGSTRRGWQASLDADNRSCRVGGQANRKADGIMVDGRHG